MSRLVTWLVLLAFSSAAVWDGRLGVALGLGALKALLVGAEFMELRHAHRLHAAAFAAFVVAVAVGVGLLAG
jgi:hypothetical protein